MRAFLLALFLCVASVASARIVMNPALHGGGSSVVLSCSFFVSPTGSDSNSGTTQAKPFLTLEKAKTAMEGLGTAAATTCLEGGTYARSGTLSLASANDANKTWTNVPGQTPVLDGGNSVSEGILAMESRVTINGLTVQNFTTTGIQYGNGGGSIPSNGAITNNTVLNVTNTATPGGFTHTFCILAQDAPSLQITGNTCTNSAGHGISYGTSNDTVGHVTISNNTILNYCNGPSSQDCGGIYEFSTNASTSPTVGGFVTSHNVIGAGGPQLSSGPAPACMYADDAISNVAYSFNICYGSGTYGFLIHGGRNVTHTNEIFDLSSLLFVGFQQDCTTSQNSTCPSTSPMTGDNMTNSIVYSSSAVPTTIWRFLNTSGTATTMTIAGNLYYDTRGAFHNSGTTTFSTPSPQMIDPSPTVANPLFTNAAVHNYILMPGSPAFALGFPNCPYSVDNGCAAAISGQPGSTVVAYGRGPGGMLNQLTGSTTDESKNPNSINEPGVDYPVGEWTALSALKDPLDGTIGIVATTGGACSYSATGGINGNPQFNCTGNVGSANVNIQNYNMSRGGTTCIPINFQITTTGTVTITGNYWINNGACSAVAGISKGAMLFISNGAARTEVAYNTMDANNQVWPYSYGSCPTNFVFGSNTCNPGAPFQAQGNVYFHHNFFKNFRVNPLLYIANGLTPYTGLDFENNLVQGGCATIPGEHCEYNDWSGNIARYNPAQTGLGSKFIGNTLLATTDHMNNGNGLITDQFVTNGLQTQWIIADNLYIAGTAGGASRAVAVTGHASGSTFTTDTIATTGNGESVATFGSGEQVLCEVAGHTSDQFSIMAVYNAGTNTISAGPAGGGHSTPGNATSNWAMTLGSTASSFAAGQGTASLDDGTGHGIAGTILTYTIPTIALLPGAGVVLFGGSPSSISGNIVNQLTGTTGGAGTYTFSVSGLAPATDGDIIIPVDATGNNNAFPGGWTVVGSVPCFGSGFGSGNVVRSYIATRGFAELFADTPGGPRTNTQVTRNTLDLYAYYPSNSATIMGDENGVFATATGSISGNTLTVSGVSGTIEPGYGLVTGSSFPGVLSGTYILSGSGPTYTLNQTYSSPVGPISMSFANGTCLDHPTIFNNNVDISDAAYPSSSLNAWTVHTPGDGC